MVRGFGAHGSDTRGLARTIGAAGLLLLTAAGCSPYLAGASLISLNTTRKTLMDHAVSYATGMDCSTIAFERGNPYCVDEVTAPVEGPVYHCYQTLGEVSCYAEPDPFQNDDRPVS